MAAHDVSDEHFIFVTAKVTAPYSSSFSILNYANQISLLPQVRFECRGGDLRSKGGKKRVTCYSLYIYIALAIGSRRAAEHIKTLSLFAEDANAASSAIPLLTF
jgi:hypothetical protein